MIVIGLTGSIGMGKTTTASFFAEHGVRIWDADAAVARLYGPGGAAVEPVGRRFPDCVGPEGVDRTRLKGRLLGDPAALADLEAIVHPLVERERSAFLDAARADGAEFALLDVPLLFEVGADRLADVLVVASAAPETQAARVLARPGMTAATLAALLSRQIPDQEKRRRADYVVETDHGLEPARRQVADLIAELRAKGPPRARQALTAAPTRS